MRSVSAPVDLDRPAVVLCEVVRIMENTKYSTLSCVLYCETTLHIEYRPEILCVCEVPRGRGGTPPHGGAGHIGIHPHTDSETQRDLTCDSSKISSYLSVLRDSFQESVGTPQIVSVGGIRDTGHES